MGIKSDFVTKLDRYKLSAAGGVVVAAVFPYFSVRGGGFFFLSILQRILLERNYVSSSSFLGVVSRVSQSGGRSPVPFFVVYTPPCRGGWSHTTSDFCSAGSSLQFVTTDLQTSHQNLSFRFLLLYSFNLFITQIWSSPHLPY